MFFARIYVKAWITAPLAVKAPNNDLSLYKDLEAYKTINKGISETTTEKMGRHLWYLSEELVALSLFDDNVTENVKEEIVEVIKRNDDEDQEPPTKRVTVALSNLKSKTLSSFASANTKMLFKKLNLPDSFLTLPVSEWEGNSDFQTARELCKSLAVTNDHAERAIALIQNFSGRLTKDEEQLQYLLQAVSHQQKLISEPLKKALK